MTTKEIGEALEEGESLKTIAQAYSEIANLKIKRIRGQVERNRVFFVEISRVYALIKKLAIKKRISLPRPKKSVSLIITSNHRFYGSINSNLIEFFIIATKKLDTDIILINKAAIDYFKTLVPAEAGIHTNITQQIMLKEDQPDSSELIQLTNIIKPYNQVLIFHSRLKSLLIQEPIVTDITAISAPPHLEDKFTRESTGLSPLPGEQEFKFIFEPELPKILAFFDNQILTLLLESTFLESELSRTASRFITMDQAENEANKFILEYKKLEAFTKRNMINNKLLENFATIIASRRDPYESI